VNFANSIKDSGFWHVASRAQAGKTGQKRTLKI